MKDGTIIPVEEKDDDLQEKINLYGFCTVWEIFQTYGIDRQKTCRYIRDGKLKGFMKSETDKDGQILTIVKWYVVKDELYSTYIEKNKKRG